MKINTLKYFITLAQSKSINEAAKKLYVAQPSLTKALKYMESELGLLLFYRTRSGITLTETGRKILPEAQQIVRYYDGWLKLAKNDTPRCIYFYQHISFSDFMLPDIILNMREKRSDLTIDFRIVADPEQHITPDTFEPVLAILVCDKTKQRELAKIQGNHPVELMRGEYQCLVNHESPLVGRKNIPLEELKDMYLILPTKFKQLITGNSFLAPLLNNIARAVSPNHIVELDTLQNVINTVRNHRKSYAISFFPALNRYQNSSGARLHHIPFYKQTTKGALCLFYSHQAATQYPAIGFLVKVVREVAGTFLKECNAGTERVQIADPTFKRNELR